MLWMWEPAANKRSRSVCLFIQRSAQSAHTSAAPNSGSLLLEVNVLKRRIKSSCYFTAVLFFFSLWWNTSKQWNTRTHLTQRRMNHSVWVWCQVLQKMKRLLKVWVCTLRKLWLRDVTCVCKGFGCAKLTCLRLKKRQCTLPDTWNQSQCSR